MPNMKTVGQRKLKLLGRQAFLVKAPVTLTFEPVTSKSIGVLLIMTDLHAKYEDCGSKET
jgi:hypothetical protein